MKDNQIEEMAKDLENHTCMSEFQAEIASRMLYAKGYRKASEVAREIFDEFHNMLLKFVSDFDDGLEKANDKATTVVLDCARETILLVILSLAGLKKKYTKEK